eukprot:CAMPEP_0177643482 /NCGR_PEP_ID=MMETSP0447-20121125/8177_1 /TAXON_ID=0 /ORGANISM="Stygamoeba regulata, Strain BSH-02190019" /LENGTH=732 /DNA_ID=CAMNT_0019145777 /DNA_START=75 /DNA_END=2270 /DNA_ORIENTATION=-
MSALMGDVAREVGTQVKDGAMDVWSQITPTGTLVEKATSDDNQATPGHLYNDLTKLTFRSVKSCQNLEMYLLRRLKKDSPVVKLKALTVIKHVLDKGHPSFKSDLQRQTSAINECLQFRGPPDPLRGDAPYMLVRQEAQEIMNMLYQESSGSSGSMAQHSMSSLSGGGGGGYSPQVVHTSGGMTGIGNYQPKPKSAVSELFDRAKNAALDFIVPDPKGPKPWEQSSGGGYGSGTYNSGASGQAGYGAHGGYGGGAGGHFRSAPALASPTSASSSSPYGATYAETRATAATSPATMSTVTSTAPISASSPVTHEEPGDYEARLVDRITEPGGVRAVPTREALNTFIKKVATLDVEVVGCLLEDKLESPSWQSQLKTLYVIESLIQKPGQVGEQYLEFFFHSEYLEPLVASPKATVRSKAQQLIDLIQHLTGEALPGVEDSAKSVPVSLLSEASLPPSSSAQAAPPPLADFGPSSTVNATPSTPAATAATQASVQQTSSLFAGLQLVPEPAVVVPTAVTQPSPSSTTPTSTFSASSSTSVDHGGLMLLDSGAGTNGAQSGTQNMSASDALLASLWQTPATAPVSSASSAASPSTTLPLQNASAPPASDAALLVPVSSGPVKLAATPSNLTAFEQELFGSASSAPSANTGVRTEVASSMVSSTPASGLPSELSGLGVEQPPQTPVVMLDARLFKQQGNMIYFDPAGVAQAQQEQAATPAPATSDKFGFVDEQSVD